MSLRAVGGFIRPGYNPLRVPNAPTIGTAGPASATSISVPFTAPACVGGGPVINYTAISSPGCKIGSATSSPIVVACLTQGTSYTFRVFATNSYGPSSYSAASNSAIPVAFGQQAYTTAGTYSWVAPAGVTSVAVVAVGPGGQVSSSTTITTQTCATYASFFIGTCTVAGYPGQNNSTSYQGSKGGSYVGDGGGVGGPSGGYSAVGGCGSSGGGVGILGQGANGIGGNGAPFGGGQGQNGQGGGGGGGGGPNGNGASGGGAAGYTGNGGSGGTATYCPCYWGYPGSPGTAGSGGSGTTYGGASGGFVYGHGGGGLGWKNNIAVTPGNSYSVKVSGNGAVRIIWPGSGRSFPTTNTGNL